ncbi:unnamed protein product [Thelazia callipaeda]|uniref:F-box domain-containing protein n=1 Tax=Thelazia callipaeda TaxID=103827 RepID=A0A158RBN9_THECL|nr:unnamed protein product [Thelazia callipaeda]
MFVYANLIEGYVSRTRVSAVEVWRNDSENGEVQVAHGINSWPALLQQLNEPILERSTMIEGDVFLYRQRKHHNRAIPLMSAPLRMADRITFKDWLKEVAKLRKVIKINVRSTAAVRPVLQYLFAASEEISSPVVLHANVFRSPRSNEVPVEASELVDGAKKYFPDATLSIGWTKSNLSELTIPQINIGWRELLQVLALIKNIEQPLMLAIRLSTAVYSAEQITFLLGVRSTISVLIWSDETDLINDWSEIIALRSGPYSKRLVFDLHTKHTTILKLLPYYIITSVPEFNRNRWNLIEFPSVWMQSSGAVVSDEGIAFLNWPTAFLISLFQAPVFPDIQRLTAKLIFVKKKRYMKDEWLKDSGFVIYLLEKVTDLQSPEINTGIKVFIGYNGRLSIENREKQRSYYNMKAAGRVQSTGNCCCYDVELLDKGWRVDVTVTNDDCRGRKLKNPTTISLETSLTK